MRGIKLSALTLAVYVLVRGAASAQGDITGAWEVTVESPQGAATIEVTFTQVGEVVTGAVQEVAPAASEQEITERRADDRH